MLCHGTLKRELKLDIAEIWKPSTVTTNVVAEPGLASMWQPCGFHLGAGKAWGQESPHLGMAPPARSGSSSATLPTPPAASATRTPLLRTLNAGAPAG